MTNARTLEAVHTHTHTSNSIRKIGGAKAFSYSAKNIWAINNNCSFNVQKNEAKPQQSTLIINHTGVTLVALVVTILFSYDEMIKFSNSKGFLLATI